MKKNWFYRVRILFLLLALSISSVPVTVEAAKPYVESLSIKSEPMVVLGVGSKSTIKATVSVNGKANKKVKYVSADEDVATVSSKGVITALKEGMTHVTVSTKGAGQNGKKLSKTVYVLVLNDANQRVTLQAALLGCSKEDLLKNGAFNTLEEVASYLKGRFSYVWGSAGMWNPDKQVYWIQSAQELLYTEVDGDVDRADMNIMATELLKHTMEIETAYAFFPDLESGYMSSTICLVKKGDKYDAIDMVNLMGIDPMYSLKLPEAKDVTKKEYIEIVKKQYPDVHAIYISDKSQTIEYAAKLCENPIVSPKVTPDYLASLDKLEESFYANYDPANISQYKISKILGGTTLTPEEAKALVGKSAKEVAKEVKTAADLVMFMMASRMTMDVGDIKVEFNGDIWQRNKNAQEVIDTGSAVCGSFSNLANVLLDGDYEEVGFIIYGFFEGYGGGHVTTYIKDKGKYYFIDFFNGYVTPGFEPSQEMDIFVCDSLEEYKKYFPVYWDYSSVVFACDTPSQHYPNIFAWNEKAYYIPSGLPYTLIYQAEGDNAIQLKTKKLDYEGTYLDFTK